VEPAKLISSPWSDHLLQLIATFILHEKDTTNAQ